MNAEKNKKRCSKCKQEKSLSEFYKKKSTKDGFHYQCKKCHNQGVKKSFSKKPIEIQRKIYRRDAQKRREKYPEKERERRRNYKHNNPDIIKKYSKDSVLNCKKFYIKNLIRLKYNISNELITDDMIELERETIQFNRKLRSYKNGNK